MPPKPEPYGTWKTCITEDFVIKKITNTIDEVLVDPIKSTVYRLESRPRDQGRGVLVRVAEPKDYDVTPNNYNVRTGVHAYGGAAATVFNGTAYFSSVSLDGNKDGRVFKVVDTGPGQDIKAITPKKDSDKYCFAGLAVHPESPKFIVAILEDHTKGDKPQDVANVLCLITDDGKPDVEPKPIVNADPLNDFYGPPAFSTKGTHIAWQHWKHPFMPWDDAKIYIADVKIDGSSFKLDKVRAVPFDLQGVKHVSLAYPNWSNDNTLIFTSDVSGFANPWKYDVSKDPLPSAVFSGNVEQDFGCPMWSLHFFPFAVLDETLALFIGTEKGHDSLYCVDLITRGSPSKLDTECVVIDGLRSLGKVTDGKFKVVFAGTKEDKQTELIYRIVPDGYDVSLPPSVTDIVEKDWISLPIPYDIQGNDGLVHVVFYAPKNPDFSRLRDEKPPCIVHVHGGPEWLQPQGLDWTKQYFTSRGWAWVDVNYGGSSGYGRKYRERLVNRWGVVDTDDCISAVQELSNRHGLIDPKRVCIRGGSAGGFTTYAALSYGRHQGVFAAGTSIYGGVADLRSLTKKAEKFELCYTEKFMGGSIDDDKFSWIYDERSPITHAGDIKVPLLILHGKEDPVVPFEQAQKMYKSAGVTADLQLYPREGHHFGEEEHIKDALWRERDCYERTLKLKDSDAI